jgi:hypothetical protein
MALHACLINKTIDRILEYASNKILNFLKDRGWDE